MSTDDFKTGAVIRYPYLWTHQSQKGETEGRKERPVAVAVRIKAGPLGDTIILFPITWKQPAPAQFSAEIPHREKLRAGLDADKRLWIILGEINIDQIGNSAYLRDQRPSGYLSRSFFMPLVLEFIRLKEEVQSVKRTL